MEAQIEIINIKWDGPLTPKEAYKKNKSSDYGVYQYYGDHPVYGLDVLLEIGMASDRTFGKRLKKYGFEGWNQNIQIYLGCICIEKESVLPSDKTWGDMIDRAEKLLIHACYPAFNGFAPSNPDRNKKPQDADRYKKLLILNWEKYRSLPAAVSGYRVMKESLDNSFRIMGK